MLLTSKYLNFLARTNKFDNVSVDFLIDHAKDKDEMANLIIKNKKHLKDSEIEKLLDIVKNKDELIEFITESKYNQIIDNFPSKLLKLGFGFNNKIKNNISENVEELFIFFIKTYDEIEKVDNLPYNLKLIK